MDNKNLNLKIAGKFSGLFHLTKRNKPITTLKLGETREMIWIMVIRAKDTIEQFVIMNKKKLIR